MMMIRGEKPNEHGAFCSGEKNGRAVVGEKLGAAGEKLGEEEPAKRGKLWCVWSTKRHEKETAAQRPGKKLGLKRPKKKRPHCG